MPDKIEKIPPYDKQAESALIGSILIDSEVIYDIKHQLQPDDFFTSELKTIYKACLDIANRGEAISSITVARELKEKLKDIGGAAYLVHLTAETPTSLHAEWYAKIVKNTAIFRKTISMGFKIQEMGYSESNPEKLISDCEKLLIDLQKEISVPKLLSPNDVLKNGTEFYAELRNGKRTGINLGINELDDMLGGLFGGELCYIAARPGIGKTTLMLRIADFVGRKFGNVALFSLEQNWKEIITKLISQDIQVSPRKLRIGNYNDILFDKILESLGKVVENNLYFYNTTGLSNVVATTETIYSLSSHMKTAYGLSAVMIDYIGLINDEHRDEYNRINYISRNLKVRLAEGLDIPVICICQLNREPEHRLEHEPQLSDLRSSGALEQDADTVLMLYRPELYKEELEKENADDIKGQLQVFIRKHRPIGEVVNNMIRMYWDSSARCYLSRQEREERYRQRPVRLVAEEFK